MRVLALTKYGSLGASSRVRTLQYLPRLAASGIAITVCPLLENGYLERLYAHQAIGPSFLVRAYIRRIWNTLKGRPFDLVWIEKELMPWVPAFVERLLLAGVPYVLDYDDAIFHTYDQHPRRPVRRLMGRKIDRVMRQAALIIAGNGYLAERAHRAGASRVEVLPSVIDVSRYGPVTPPPDGAFTIGWIGSPGSERFLEGVREVLADATLDPGVRLVLVGATAHALEGIRREVRPWSGDTEVEEMRRFDVGIMPLSDTPWARGKCGYKLIQCMGAGRAVIASPVGMNAEIVQDGVTGFLASTPQQWRQSIRTLREDRERSVLMGTEGRRVVEQRYDLAVTAPRLVSLLRSVGER